MRRGRKWRRNLCTKLSTTRAVEKNFNVKNRKNVDRRVQGKKKAINVAKTRYRAQRESLILLGMPADDPQFKPLNEGDVKAFVRLMDEQELGDSHRKPSWIWGDFGFIGKATDEDIKAFLIESEYIIPPDGHDTEKVQASGCTGSDTVPC